MLTRWIISNIGHTELKHMSLTTRRLVPSEDRSFMTHTTVLRIKHLMMEVDRLSHAE